MTYKYEVILEVEVDALDEGDAFDLIQENFGVGEQFGVTVTECTFKERKR